MATFIITNCGDIRITINDFLHLDPGSCFGWKLDLANPVTIIADGEAKFFLTHNQEPDIIQHTKVIDGYETAIDDDGNEYQKEIAHDDVKRTRTWTPNLIIDDRIVVEPGNRTKVIAFTDMIMVKEESVI